MVKKEEVVKKTKAVSSQGEVRVEKVLVENFVSLQHVMTNLAVKFENLSGQISKLLELFEISAKALAEKGALGDERADKRAAEKLDTLLEQTKVIAKGLALLHERDSEPQYAPAQPMRTVQQMPQQRPPYDFSKNPRLGR